MVPRSIGCCMIAAMHIMKAIRPLIAALAAGFLTASASHAAADTDGDGVADSHDECAGTAPAATVNHRGCEFDNDGDGVVDRLDSCPDTRRGALVNMRGCEPDSDNDGVADRLDRCGNSPAAARIDGDGCEFADILPMRGVSFESGSAVLTVASMLVVQHTAQLVNRYSELCFLVEGYTDNVGPASDNLRLSRQRAAAVLAELAANGVAASRLTAVGYGENSPVASNRTAEGREKNRRVQLRVQEDCGGR